jgi:hypothetical protein
MPILPLDVAVPPIAVLGVMLFPSCDDEAKREAFEASMLAPVLGEYATEGGELSDTGELLAWTLQRCGPHTVNRDDLADRWRGGTTIGELVKVMLWLTRRFPKDASWSKAVERLEAYAGRQPFSRTAIYGYKRRFGSVAHLWAAYCIRERQIGDLQRFLTLSEGLRIWGQRWRRPAAKAEPIFDSEMWRPADIWRPPAGCEPPAVDAPDFNFELRPPHAPRG